MFPTKPYFLIIVLILLNFFGVLLLSTAKPLIPALYVIGDSLFDSGNNNWLPTLAKVNYPPYGHNFPQGPTGRFSNGKLLTDFIAEYVGLPYPPPYVNPLRVFQPKKLTGYSYASGACGILPDTGKDIGVCLNLDEQMRLFKRTASKHLSSQLRNPTQLTEHLAKSIFMVTMGSNDYLGNYFDESSDDNRERYNPQEFTQLLISKLSQKLQELYYLGARKVVVLELGPLGCLGSMVRRFKPKGRCAENVNEVLIYFNTQLSLMLQNLTKTLENSHFVLGHAYWLGYDAIINPEKYGLSDSSNPCCKTWGNGTLTCMPLLKPCSHPNKHFFWDSAHPSEGFNSLVASRCINGSSVCVPLNIQQLVQV